MLVCMLNPIIPIHGAYDNFREVDGTHQGFWEAYWRLGPASDIYAWEGPSEAWAVLRSAWGWESNGL